MNLKPDDKNGLEGKLPERAPLANPYVPFQLVNQPQYQPQQGLVRGTLFPGLELPFMGMINKNDLPLTPLTELQMLSFAIQELALYLDTHTDDMEALDLYRNYQKKYESAQIKYEQTCGPIDHMSANEGPYRWLCGPWPWEYTRNREV